MARCQAGCRCARCARQEWCAEWGRPLMRALPVRGVGTRVGFMARKKVRGKKKEKTNWLSVRAGGCVAGTGVPYVRFERAGGVHRADV